MPVSITHAREAIELADKLDKLHKLRDNLKMVERITNLDKVEFKKGEPLPKDHYDQRVGALAWSEMHNVSFGHFRNLCGIEMRDWLVDLMVERVEFSISDARERLKALGFSE